MPVILLTNDDGISAAGLRALEDCLQGLGTVVVTAPDRERSAVSHGLTIREPLNLTRIAENRYSLSGTPADCIIYSLMHLVLPPPDLVVSGINHGANLGDDIYYSGTVAAAREAAKHGIPSIAVSQAYDELPPDFEGGKAFIRTLVESRLNLKERNLGCLNVNIPSRRIRGARVTRQGTAGHFPHFNPQFADDGAESAEVAARKNLPVDFRTVEDGYVSITPLLRDQTDYRVAEQLKGQISETFTSRSAVRIWVDRIKELG